MKVLSYERTDSHHKYAVSARDGHSVEVVYRRRRGFLASQPLQAEGGAVVGWAKAEEVQAFREASDWLSRFVHRHDGSPRRLEPVFADIVLPEPVEEKC